MKTIVIYTKDFCPYCKRAISLLQQKGVPFSEIDVTFQDSLFQKIQDKTHWDTVPQIFIDDAFIGGCDDLYQLDQKGILDEMLGISK